MRLINENEVNGENKSLLRRRRRRRAEDDPEKMIRRLRNNSLDMDAPPLFSFWEGNDRDPFVHLRNPTRFLQQSLGQAAAKNDGTEDGSGPSVLRQVFTSLFWIVGFVVIFKCCGHKRNPRPTPSRDVLLQQRERQRELQRQEHRRRLGLPPTLGQELTQAERAELQAKQAELATTIRELVQKRLTTTQVEKVLRESDFESSATTTDGSDDDEEAQQVIRLTSLKDEATTKDHKVAANICAICLEDYHAGETIVWSSNDSCKDAFHHDCIVDYTVLQLVDQYHKQQDHHGSELMNTLDIARLEKSMLKDPPSCPCCRQDFWNKPFVASASNDDSGDGVAEEGTAST